MKRDEVVLPIEADSPPPKKADPVREGMHHYYNRDADALQRLLQRLKDQLEKQGEP